MDYTSNVFGVDSWNRFYKDTHRQTHNFMDASESLTHATAIADDVDNGAHDAYN